MRALLAALFVPLLGLGAVACEESSPPPPLAAGQLARVGELRITSDQLDELGATPAQLDRVRQDLERDLLLAQARGGLASPRGAAVERGWLGRALFEALMEEARAAGAPSDAEWAAERERAWLEVDRPRCLRTVDATVGVSPLEPDERAFQLAERIARELADLPSTPDGSAPVAEFAARVRAIDPQGLPTTLVERPATSDDGRHAILDARDQQAPALDADAARAGFAGLVRVGQVSGVLGGRDGFHVVMVTEIIAPQRLEGPELEARLLTAVLASRARPRLSQLLERLRRERPVSIVEAQASWTRRVWQAQ